MKRMTETMTLIGNVWASDAHIYWIIQTQDALFFMAVSSNGNILDVLYIILYTFPLNSAWHAGYFGKRWGVQYNL